ncbi:MAG: serine/threonine-protein kinase [Gammaproteobacteria bacterium]|nr:serine/threonine-protein kinase [Gammaproteobacteria bacterium]MCI0590451.1 serine/threonine-protein kinase [Gammaproteobacteria bacterium]
MPETVLEKLGKYEVIKQIGRGNMGVVYLGHDPFADRPVALKVAIADSLKDNAAQARFRKMFLNEAHIAGLLKHPNIIAVYDAGIEGNACYLVMEHVPGGNTLRSYSRPDDLLPVEKVVEIAFKCAKALDYAHRQGVVHRDIKPTNILVTEDQDVKISDFSIAHVVTSDGSNTMPMGFVGSPRYMSPEHVQEDYITKQSDLFSLGIVMYELLTGHHPFAADTFSQLIHRIINEEPLPMRNHRPDLPDVLEKIVKHTLEKNPQKRYKMGLNLAADLSLVFDYLGYPKVEISKNEKFDIIRQLNFFQEFPESEIWEIVEASSWQEHEPGDEIIRAGDIEDSFYIIASGEVEVRKGRKRLSTLKEGECFGEMGYITKSKRTASIIAKSFVTLMKINATLIEQVSIECQLRFSKVFLRTLVERLSATTEIARSQS